MRVLGMLGGQCGVISVSSKQLRKPVRQAWGWTFPLSSYYLCLLVIGYYTNGRNIISSKWRRRRRRRKACGPDQLSRARYIRMGT